MPYYVYYETGDANKVVRNISINDITYAGLTIVEFENLPDTIPIGHTTRAIGTYQVVSDSQTSVNTLVPYTSPDETTQQIIDRRLNNLRRQYDIIQDGIRQWWPNVQGTASLRTTSTQAVKATRVWADHATVITSRVIRGNILRVGVPVFNTEEDKIRIINRFEEIFLNEDILYTWYTVLMGNSSFRASWSADTNRSDGAPTYADWINSEDGTPRGIDGRYSGLVFIGVSFFRNFYPNF